MYDILYLKNIKYIFYIVHIFIYIHNTMLADASVGSESQNVLNCKVQIGHCRFSPGCRGSSMGCKWLLAQLAVCHERHAKGAVKHSKHKLGQVKHRRLAIHCMPSKRPDRAKSHGASVFSLVFVLSPPRDAVSRNCTVGFLSQIVILSCNFRSYFVRLSACINPVGTEWIRLGDSTCCTLVTLINDLLSDSEGFSATSASYKDLASTTCTIGSDMLPLKAGFSVKISVKKKFKNEERSAPSFAAIASAAKVERQMRGLLPVFQSTKCPAGFSRGGREVDANYFDWSALEKTNSTKMYSRGLRLV